MAKYRLYRRSDGSIDCVKLKPSLSERISSYIRQRKLDRRERRIKPHEEMQIVEVKDGPSYGHIITLEEPKLVKDLANYLADLYFQLTRQRDLCVTHEFCRGIAGDGTTYEIFKGEPSWKDCREKKRATIDGIMPSEWFCRKGLYAEDFSEEAYTNKFLLSCIGMYKDSPDLELEKRGLSERYIQILRNFCLEEKQNENK